MKNNIYNVDTLYEIIRDYYLSCFPYATSYLSITPRSDIFTVAITNYLNKTGCPVTIKFEAQKFVTAKDYFIEKDLEKIRVMPTEQQHKIIDFIDTNLTEELNKVMSDLIAMHSWLVQDEYITKSIENNASKMYMSSKFINTEKFKFPTI
ncbi:hypothetical protein V0242_11725 [Aeromonas hydrophila]|uniref:hypothetical protein n=1 Tax=Aeromonas hydrophila TaxID=644 RepID=UPI002ED340CA|nr:hypothetical protein V0242_11725 [Aeromonas hydrophila]